MSFNFVESEKKPGQARSVVRPPARRPRDATRSAGLGEPRLTPSDRDAEGRAGHSFGRVRVLAGPRWTAPAPRAMDVEGQTGTASVAGPSLLGEEAVNFTPPQFNAWGEMDGELTSDVQPEVFTNGGKTGSAAVHWGGGGGGKGNQGVGSATLVAPVYEGRDPPAAGGTAQVWIRTGTGDVQVTRSYVGVLTGANGANWYITANASARIDRHEVTHINSTKGFHDARVVPLEARVRQHRGEPNALSQGATQAEAIAALKTFVDWNTAIANFRSDDTTANTPGGTTDTTDSATADFYQNYGPRTGGGVNYANYVDTPPGPGP